MGLRIPNRSASDLELQAARSDQPVTAVSEAGRGRFYYLVPGGEVALGELLNIPTSHQLVGMVVTERGSIAPEGRNRFNPQSRLGPLPGPPLSC